jgi:beta-lactamase class A
VSTKEVNDIENAVRGYITEQKSAHNLLEASFYFRDLNGGPWALVNPEFRSIPASLLKVPTALTVYKRAMSDPSFLLTQVTLESGVNVNRAEHFQPPEHMQPYTPYTIKETVDRMLRYSDNAGLYMISDIFTAQELQDAYSELGIVAPKIDEAGYTMTVKAYSSFFRVLYNATYLSREYSEHLLSTLAQTTFDAGIVTGLPRSVNVSHKFGEMRSPDGTLQLHDCGIVYKPHQPYLLCIMTKGGDYGVLAKVISRISKIVYDNLDSTQEARW